MSNPEESLAVSLRLLRRTQASQKMRPKITAPPTAAPTPMPALAPVVRPLTGVATGLVPGVGRREPGVNIMLVTDELVTSANELDNVVDVGNGVVVVSGGNVAVSVARSLQVQSGSQTITILGSAQHLSTFSVHLKLHKFSSSHCPSAFGPGFVTSW